RAALFYFRTTADGRIAFGGAGRAGLGSKVGPRYDHDPASLDHVYEGFRRFFPSFEGVGITEAWGGAVDVAALHHPVVGTLRGGAVHHATGYSGNGVAPSHLLGRALAALALDADEETLALPMVGAKAKRFPPEPFRSVGAAVVQSAIMRRERLEDEGRRVGWLTRFLGSLPRRMGYALGRHD
ncbi:MAG TPA: FAD-dependent oxidoreductase, partial [Actinomycetota bacterium]|nr:FAD-dependent oxidoreductase [Actinomycetota bacterium]